MTRRAKIAEQSDASAATADTLRARLSRPSPLAAAGRLSEQEQAAGDNSTPVPPTTAPEHATAPRTGLTPAQMQAAIEQSLPPRTPEATVSLQTTLSPETDRAGPTLAETAGRQADRQRSRAERLHTRRQAPKRVEGQPAPVTELPEPVRAPPRATSSAQPIKITRRAGDEGFSDLPDTTRAKIEALIDRQAAQEASFDHASVVGPPSDARATAATTASVPKNGAGEAAAGGGRARGDRAGDNRASDIGQAGTSPSPGTPSGQPQALSMSAVRGNLKSTSANAASQAAVAPLAAGRSQTKDKPDRAATSAGVSLSEKLDVLRINRDGELWTALMQGRQALYATAAFSFVINLLMLTGPLFMLQVYDRVMASGSVPTLIALSILTACMYAAIGIFELIRSRVVVRVGREFDDRIADRVFKAALKRSVLGQRTSTAAIRELDSIRQFVSGSGPLTMFDAPWTPIYLLIIFAFHWVLGVAATVGAIILLVLAYVSEKASREPLLEAQKKTAQSMDLAEVGQRNSEVIAAMGMVDAYRLRWQATNAEAMAWQGVAADRLGAVTATTKTLRLAFQSMMLGVGAALALSNEISTGTIVAATIIFGRALAPVEQAVGQWRGLLRAADSFGKIDELLKSQPAPTQRTKLPAPKGILEVSSLRVATPDSRKLVLASINFKVSPGEMLAVIGPSASGKSTLTRAIVGLWPPAAGQIRLDGATLDQWGADELGQHIGYLPQSVELFAGTVSENIARFSPNADDAQIVEAAKRAHAHELILELPDGYQTELGDFGAHLSAGQRQRIGLARALFSNPVLVVLDEPNSNLDRAGDLALAAAIDGMRAQGQTVILVSHRVQAIGKANLLLYLDKGIQRAFGPRDEVLAQLQAGLPEEGATPDPARQKRTQATPNQRAPNRAHPDSAPRASAPPESDKQ